MEQNLIEQLATALAQASGQQLVTPRGVRRGGAQMRQRAVSGLATPFGCCNFFDRCGDGDLMSLHYAGTLPLLDWMGFNPSDECYKVAEFITYVRPEYSQGSPTGGYISDACADPNGIEYGSSKITLENFGRIGRTGPTRDLMKPMKYCINDPVWRLDGTPVADEREWDMRFIMDQILNDIMTLVVTGSDAVAGQFDGLEQWVSTGYTSGMLDSVVVNWAGNPMSGGAGITWNGAAVAATWNFVDVLLAVVRRIRQRISWNPRLRTMGLQPGDMIIALPTDLIDCLLDHYTCWSVCDGAQYNEVAIQSYEARRFRDGLLGGLFGFGRIFLDGYEIPLLGYDFGLIKGPKTGDIYVLTGSVGSWRIWEGEHISASAVPGMVPGGSYFSTDGGRALWLVETDNECRTMKGWMHPRMFCRAPWAQARFQSVQCEKPGGFLSPDPTETSFYPVTSFGADASSCP